MFKREIKLTGFLSCLVACVGLTLAATCWKHTAYYCGAQTITGYPLGFKVSCNDPRGSVRSGTSFSNMGYTGYQITTEDCHWSCIAFDIFNNAYPLSDDGQ